MNLNEQVTQPTAKSYRKLSLTRGQFALVDAEDYDRISQWRWKAKKTPDGNFYATRSSEITLHRFLLGLKPGDKTTVDHKSGDRLDNRRDNLRLATRSQNMRNIKRRSDNTSGYKGVSKRGKKWRAYINCEGERTWLGNFSNAETAYAAYCEAAKRLHGEFARTS